MIQYTDKFILMSIKELQKESPDVVYLNDLINLLTSLASVNQGTGYIPGETKQMRDIKHKGIQYGLIGFLYQLVKDDDFPKQPKELIWERIIRNIHFNDVDKQISILNNLGIHNSLNEDEEENQSPWKMESPMKPKDEDVVLNSLISKELKEFLKPDLIS